MPLPSEVQARLCNGHARCPQAWFPAHQALISRTLPRGRWGARGLMVGFTGSTNPCSTVWRTKRWNAVTFIKPSLADKSIGSEDAAAILHKSQKRWTQSLTRPPGSASCRR